MPAGEDESVLSTIFRICQHYQVTSGKLKYHCDKTGVIKNVFSNQSTSIHEYLQTDYDLVLVAKQLVGVMPATIIVTE